MLSYIRINSIEGWRAPVFLGALFLIILLSGTAQSENTKTGTVKGRLVLQSGMPYADSPIFFFNGDTGPPPSPDLYWRTPSRTASTDADGVFRADVPQGRYFINTLIRNSDRRQHTPRGDEFIQLSLDSEGNPKAISIKSGGVLDLGDIMVKAMNKTVNASPDNITAIEGLIFDSTGKQLAGVVVYAYPNKALHGETLYSSDTSDNDGKYQLRVPGEGTYYLQARDIASGKTYALKGNASGSVAVTVTKGQQVRGIDITVAGFQQRVFDPQ